MSSAIPLGLAVPLPVETPVVRGPDIEKLKAQFRDPQAPKDFSAYLLDEKWIEFFSQQSSATSLAAQRVASTFLTEQGASIGLTTLPTAGNTGLFQVQYLAEITTAAGVSSQLDVAITFTHFGVPKTFAGTAITGNTTATIQSNTWLVSIDANTPIQYSTTYASNAAGVMKYALSIVLSAVVANP